VAVHFFQGHEPWIAPYGTWKLIFLQFSDFRTQFSTVRAYTGMVSVDRWGFLKTLGTRDKMKRRGVNSRGGITTLLIYMS